MTAVFTKPKDSTYTSEIRRQIIQPIKSNRDIYGKLVLHDFGIYRITGILEDIL